MLSLINSLHRWYRHFSAAVAALLVLVLAPGAGAGDTIECLRVFQKNKMPGTQKIRQSYTNFTYRPYKRQELSFDILIPKNDWRDIPITISTETLQQDIQQLIPLAKQKAPENETGEAQIDVAYMRLDTEMNLYDIVTLFLQNNTDSFDVLMRRKGRFNQRTVEEVLLKSRQDEKNYMARLTFSRHGDRVFMVSSSALEPEFNRYAENFTVASVSLSVHQKAATPYVEKMAVFTSTGAPKLEFSYPQSWTAKEVPGAAAGRIGADINLVVHDEESQKTRTYGYIHVRVHSKDTQKTPGQILTRLKKDFEDMPLSLDTCILKADMMPKSEAPLGRLERWNALVSGEPGEAAFLVLPNRDGFVALGLFSMRPGDNLLTWIHTWRVFEIIAGDVTGKPIDVAKLKYHTLPTDSGLKGLAAGTMNDFKQAARDQNFDNLYAALSNTFKSQTTPAKLQQAFGGFAKTSELDQLGRHTPILEGGAGLDKNGILKFSGHYPTLPDATTFSLSYIKEQTDWKLMGIRVAMKKMPPTSPSRASSPAAATGRPASADVNVLAAENGCRVIFCSSQYNQTSWSAQNLIDGQLGSGHGYANLHGQPVEIVFALPSVETLNQLCFNPYTVESSNRWAKNVAVAVSTEGPRQGFEPVGEFSLHNHMGKTSQTPPADQCFGISAVQAQYIKLRLLTNHGDDGYIELGEFKAYSPAK